MTATMPTSPVPGNAWARAQAACYADGAGEGAADGAGSADLRRQVSTKLNIPAASTSPAPRYSDACSPCWNAEYAALMTACPSLPYAMYALLPVGGVLPLSTALMTNFCSPLLMPSACILAVISELSRAATSAPSTATPVTAPISRLVFVADAAMPDRSGGTADRAEDVAGTTVLPTPIPASPRAAASGTYDGFGLIVSAVSTRPAANSTDPTRIDQPRPTAATQRFASTEASTISTVIGRNVSAIR